MLHVNYISIKLKTKERKRERDRQVLVGIVEALDPAIPEVADSKFFRCMRKQMIALVCLFLKQL